MQRLRNHTSKRRRIFNVLLIAGFAIVTILTVGFFVENYQTGSVTPPILDIIKSGFAVSVAGGTVLVVIVALIVYVWAYIKHGEL